MNTAKPFTIPKMAVYEAFKVVKANAGAAGVDKETIADFEKDLKSNLYKLWNRLSSGSYFPPPVKAVAIPKKSGGERILGIPTRASYCTSRKRVSGRWLDPGGFGNALAQFAILLVGYGNRVRHSRLFPRGVDGARLYPVIDDGRVHPVALSDLGDIKRAAWT